MRVPKTQKCPRRAGLRLVLPFGANDHLVPVVLLADGVPTPETVGRVGRVVEDETPPHTRHAVGPDRQATPSWGATFSLLGALAREFLLGPTTPWPQPLRPQGRNRRPDVAVVTRTLAPVELPDAVVGDNDAGGRAFAVGHAPRPATPAVGHIRTVTATGRKDGDGVVNFRPSHPFFLFFSFKPDR